MKTEDYADLKQQCFEKKESIRRFEEEIRELEAEIDNLKEANDTSELIEDRKSSRELTKQLFRETSPIQMHTLAAS